MISTSYPYGTARGKYSLLTNIYCTSLASLCFVKESHCQLAFPVLRAREDIIWRLTVFFKRAVADTQNILRKPVCILPCNWLPVTNLGHVVTGFTHRFTVTTTHKIKIL